MLPFLTQNGSPLMCIYNTPLTGYPRIIDRTNGQLKSVYFKYNNMMDTNCSFSVGSEMTLTTIEITNNNLRELPACLLTSALTSLTLSNNRLENISALLHPRLVPATNLSDLWLDHNFITNIGMFSYMKLTILDLSHNKIQHLNKLTFNRLPELTYLDLSWNRLTIIPAGTFKAFFFLQFLNVSHNLIREFSYLQSTLSPADINIHHNQLMYPPFYREGYNIVTAHTIKAEDNPYQCDCKAELFKKRIGLLYSKSNTKYKIQFKHLDKYLCFSPKSLHNQTLLSLNFSDVCPVVTDCPASCECSFNKTTNVTEVRCSSLNMTSLPATVPEGKVVLLFSGNGIHNVSTRGYFTRAEKLNLSRNDLEQLNSPVCELWKHLQIVDISVNKIRYLPKCFETFNLSAMALHVYGNPWTCDCTSLWMLSWFKRNKQHIPEYERMACGNSEFLGIPLNSFVASELDCDPSSYLHIAIPLGFLALFAIVLIPLAYKFRFQTQVFIHAQFHARPFDRRKLENAEYVYEVFLSYHSQNEAWVVHTLMPRLETGDRPYRACVHYRDFEVGAAVADNIVNAVQKSQCTVVILSKDYIASEWCVFEFQKAHHEVLKDGARKLVVILMEDIPMEDTFPELKVYLKRNTYLRLDDRWFWQKLFFCLPDPLNDNVNRNQRQVGKGFDNHHMHEMDDLQ
ncbi:protein toll-like [Gigantopelta aegis]|uniref:protein toll-like n=1 Tax=Gigantopelta aegis TaxID=1735272 RepID=UPI001B88AA9F|nr:protein toll-like [Gigantopelta aegis]